MFVPSPLISSSLLAPSLSRRAVLHMGLAGLLVAWSIGCGAAAIAPENQGSVQLSLQEINCSSCMHSAAKAAKAVPGVISVGLVLKKAELVVRYDRTRTSPADVIKAIGAVGKTAVIGAGKGNYRAHVAFKPDMDVKQLKDQSPDLDLMSLPVAGKVTVVDYGAEWCGPCRKVDREMYAQLLKHKPLALRRLDIGDWSSPFAKKHLAKVNTLPFILVFDANKKEIARIEGLDLPALRKAIAAGVAAIGK